MDFFVFFTYILGGTFITLAVTAIALPMGLIFGIMFALVRVYGGKKLSALAAIYSTVMRGIPPIVLLFILYFIVAGTINISAFWAGSIALGIISSSYQMEIFRGAIQSVSGGQEIAGRAIGLTRMQTIRYITLPQALRIAIPPWSNEASTVIKDSSLVYAIGVAEILRRAQMIGARSYQMLLAFTIAALIYFVLVFVTNRGLDWVERRTRIPSM
jgi:polar amino acid transport system permease protein